MSTAKLQIAAFFISVSATTGHTADIELSSFGLYEQTGENIVIDGVSTKYALGVVGIGIDSEITSKTKVAAKIGYGQNNSQSVSFSGANFTGPIRGTYINAAAQYELSQNKAYKLFAQAAVAVRSLETSSLIGSRNGLALTGQSSTTISTNDLMLAAQFKLNDTILLSLSGGLHQWHLKAAATAHYAASGVTATAKKNIDTTGIDPIFAIGVHTNKLSHNFLAEVSSRSLKSKTDTAIITGQVTYSFRF